MKGSPEALRCPSSVGCSDPQPWSETIKVDWNGDGNLTVLRQQQSIASSPFEMFLESSLSSSEE